MFDMPLPDQPMRDLLVVLEQTQAALDQVREVLNNIVPDVEVQ